MTLSCSCSDFDKSEFDHWWEPGRPAVPPPGTRCCECNAPLPEGEKRATILAGEVYDPGEIETPPPDPALLADDHEISDAAYSRAEDAWDAYLGKYGWDSDCERFERYTSEYRCERCGDLADAIEGMGFCMLCPGELIDAHEEYVNEVQEVHPSLIRREIIWSRGKDGVWHPRRKTAADKRRESIQRRIARTKAWLRYGWRIDLRWKVWEPAKRKTMRALGYEWTYQRYDAAAKQSIYRWTRKLPPWEREARGDRP